LNTDLVASIGMLIIGTPALALLAILMDRVRTHEVRELFIKRCLFVSQVISIAAGCICAGYVLYSGRPLEIGALRLVSLSTKDLAFALRIDSISVSFVLMSCILGGVVGLFASRYLHRDPGYLRFLFFIISF